MNVLIGCEESQAVTIEFRKRGINAFSCDIQDESGGHPEWHIKGDIFEVLKKKNWTALIAFPPCTHLACSGAAWFEKKRKDGRQKQGIDFFLEIARAQVENIAIENPVGIMSKIYMPPTQIIQPYYFGDKAQKTTCLWLKGFPPLYHNASPNLFDDHVTHTEKGNFFEWIDGKTGKKKRQPLWFKEARNLKPAERAKIRSKTFPGIAREMAAQWGEFLINKYK